MISRISGIMHSALLDLFQMQPDVLETTSQTTMTEWNLAHHYANSLSRYLFWYDNDNDVGKRNYGSRRPDIIFHKRQSNENNFLVIEMKKNDAIDEDDIRKIKDDWFSNPLNYRFGACISVSAVNLFKIMLFENHTANEVSLINESARTYAIRKQENDDNERVRLQEIMSQGRVPDLRQINVILDRYQCHPGR